MSIKPILIYISIIQFSFCYGQSLETISECDSVYLSMNKSVDSEGLNLYRDLFFDNDSVYLSKTTRFKSSETKLCNEFKKAYLDSMFCKLANTSSVMPNAQFDESSIFYSLTFFKSYQKITYQGFLLENQDLYSFFRELLFQPIIKEGVHSFNEKYVLEKKFIPVPPMPHE